MWSDWLQILSNGVYDSLVYIHIVGFQENKVYVATWHKCLALVLEMP